MTISKLHQIKYYTCGNAYTSSQLQQTEKKNKKKNMQITLFIFCPAEVGSQIAIDIFFP